MPTKAEKLLEKMRQSKNNWKRHDLETLYKGFGFTIDTSRGGHDKVTHPDYPTLITSLPRHKDKIAKYLVDQAIALVDELIRLQNLKGEEE